MDSPRANPVRNISDLDRDLGRYVKGLMGSRELTVTNNLLDYLLAEITLTKSILLQAVGKLSVLDKILEQQTIIIDTLSRQVEFITGSLLPEMKKTTHLLATLLSNATLTRSRGRGSPTNDLMLTREAFLDTHELHRTVAAAEDM